MTSGPEMHAYAQEQGDEWEDLPANGEGWDKPSSVDGELLAAAMRLKRYTEYLEKQYDTDVLLLAEYAVRKILGAAEGVRG